MLTAGVHVSSLLLCRSARDHCPTIGGDEWCLERVVQAIEPPEYRGQGPSYENLTAFISLCGRGSRTICTSSEQPASGDDTAIGVQTLLEPRPRGCPAASWLPGPKVPEQHGQEE